MKAHLGVEGERREQEKGKLDDGPHSFDSTRPGDGRSFADPGGPGAAQLLMPCRLVHFFLVKWKK
jgi:hypothetical protein